MNWLGKQGHWLGKDSQKTKKDGDIWDGLLPSSGTIQTDDDVMTATHVQSL